MDETGRKREAFVDELTQTQLEFMFHAKEQRKKMRREGSNSGGGGSPGKVTKNTTHIT